MSVQNKGTPTYGPLLMCQDPQVHFMLWGCSHNFLTTRYRKFKAGSEKK